MASNVRRRRAFGKIAWKPNKQHPSRIEASFPTPVWAFEKWPGLAERQSKSFPASADGEDEARGWLGRQKRLIDAEAWEPERVVRRKDLAERVTFGEYWEGWLNGRRTAKGAPLAAGTRYRLEKDIRLHLLPYFGPMRLVDVTPRTVDDWLAWLPQDQKAMRANAVKAAHAIFATAARPGVHGEPPLIPSNPFAGRMSGKYRRDRETPPVTPEELKVMHDSMPPRYALTVYIACFVEMRIGEVCALRMDNDVDLDTMTMHIRHGRLTVGPDKIGATKTASSVRDEPIPTQLADLIRDFADRYGLKSGDWLFPSVKDQSEPLHPNSLRNWFAEARERAGRPDMRFHDLRSTGLTWRAIDGATLKELMDAGGHADPRTAMIYQHAADGRRREIVDKLGSRLLPDETHGVIRTRIADIESRIAELSAERDRLMTKLKALE